MKINWKVRFKNKAWLMTFLAAIVAFIYQLFTMFGIAPAVEQEKVMELAKILLSILVAVGVIVDPTTKGASDSDLAMSYSHHDITEINDMGDGTDEREFISAKKDLD